MAESALPAQPMESPAAQDQTGPEKGAGCTLYNSTKNRHWLYNSTKTDTGCTVYKTSTQSGTGCTVYNTIVQRRVLAAPYNSREIGTGSTLYISIEERHLLAV